MLLRHSQEQLQKAIDFNFGSKIPQGIFQWLLNLSSLLRLVYRLFTNLVWIDQLQEKQRSDNMLKLMGYAKSNWLRKLDIRDQRACLCNEL